MAEVSWASRLSTVDDRVLAASISWLTWPLRWSITPVKPFSPSTICLTWVCFPLVMVASDWISWLMASASVWERSPPASFWMSYSSTGVEVEVRTAPLVSGRSHPVTGLSWTSS